MKKEDKKTTLERIHDAALLLFVDQGFSQTTTRQIARELGITQPNLYHYYKNKESLYVAVMSEEIQNIGQGLDGIFDKEKSLEENIYNLTKYAIEGTKGDMMQVQYDMDQSLSPDTEEYMKALWHENSYEKLYRVFDYFQENLKNETAHQATIHYFIAILPIYRMKKLNNFDFDSYVNMLLHGLIK